MRIWNRKQAAQVTIFALLATVSTLNAQANTCIEAFLKPRLKIMGVAETAFRADIEEVHPKIENWLGSELELNVELTANSFYSDAFYLPKARTVRVGARLGDRTRQSRVGVFSHEATHSYTHDHFRYFIDGQWLTEDASRLLISAKIRDIENEPSFRSLAAKREELADAIHRAVNRENNPSFEKTRDEFRKVRAELESRLEPTVELTRLLNRKLKMARAYHELFSDVVAAVMTQQKGVIADALGIAAEGPYTGTVAGATQRKNNPAGARPRAFEINPFKDWVPENRFVNEYTALDPARGVLWELYLKRLSPNEGPKFTEVFRIASEREVERLHQIGVGENLESGSTLAEINRDFLRAFRELARRHNLQMPRDRRG